MLRTGYRLISAADARAQQQTSCMALLLSIDGTDRRTPDHYIDPRVLRGSKRGKSPSGPTAIFCPAGLPGAGVTAVVIPRERE